MSKCSTLRDSLRKPSRRIVRPLYSGACAPRTAQCRPSRLIVITAAGIALRAATLLVALFAAPLLALLAMFLATALVPDGISQHVQNFDGGRGVIALDDKFATPGTSFRGSILNDDRQARTPVQHGGERVMKQLPMMALTLERHPGHVQVALAHVANGYGAIGTAARRHSAEVCGTAHGKLAGRRVAGNIDRCRGRRIITGHGDRRRLGTNAGGLETERNRESISRPDRDRIRKYLRG